MKHARPDYDRIQDPEEKIPADEPVFLLRAQDTVAPDVVREWARRAASQGCDQNIIDAAFEHAARMDEWQLEHGSKLADMP